MLRHAEVPIEDEIRALALRDGRFSPEAFRFLFEALPVAVKLAGRAEAEAQDRHVTGQEVLAGLRAHALALFGPLGKAVWNSWGIHATLDWGHVVFLLVENGHLRRQESDTLEDFRDGFDLEAELVHAYRLPLVEGLGAAEDGG